FQAEDGILDLYVTGVQTCALSDLSPSSGIFSIVRRSLSSSRPPMTVIWPSSGVKTFSNARLLRISSLLLLDTGPAIELTSRRTRSEERRVGKEWRCGGEWRGLRRT